MAYKPKVFKCVSIKSRDVENANIKVEFSK